MAEVLVDADGEMGILDELSAQLPPRGWALTKAAGTIGTKIPTTSVKPAEFIRVLAPGGSGRDLVTAQHTLVIEAYSTKEQRARDLCALAAALVVAAARAGSLGGLTCYRASSTVPGNLPHPDVPTHVRFTSTISVDLRRATV